MYSSRYDVEAKDDINIGKKLAIWATCFLFLISGAAWFFSRATSVADTAIVRYEEFQEIYNTCRKIDTDLGVIRVVPESDRMFDSFSKAAMVTQKQQQLTRWVEEYNAKSKMWNRALWKSSELPYQLDVNQFGNFKGGQ